MSALHKEVRVEKDINLIYDFTEKPNLTQLKAHKDRAVVAKLRADLVLPSDKILTVDIDFDTNSGYHNNSIMVMDDFGVEMIATAFEVKYGKIHADNIRKAWNEKQEENDPRKPTYILVQKPEDNNSVPNTYAKCGGEVHPKDIAPKSIT
ncbi:hypothetical protein [Thalassotalea profundi]|uniref:Uncharacterized protein n=1 Tax=Thalassotalea profundi TaxID=2036687 RepID=A0ABQ3IL10_9GAMM|nr:hypothetical protein [Thalassotalea profundi]GHE85077.1 hypothetical protein GCM10011501_12510 [Thalassotalea profundi]